MMDLLAPFAVQQIKKSEKPKVADGKLDFLFNPARDITV